MNKIDAISDAYPYCSSNPYISFDLFDTLIRRRYLKVNEVHDTVSAYALALLGRREASSPFDLTLLRYRLSDALKKFDGTGTQEPLIEEVWDRILEREIADADARLSAVEKIVAFELAVEMANLAVVDGAVELLRKLRADGKILIATSDMYFSFEIMNNILEKLELKDLFDHVYISADRKFTKHSGDLFQDVLSDIDISPNQILHVGDNQHSDISMAVKSGVSCVLVDQPSLLELERPKYGNRFRIGEEVSDLIKLHLSSLLFDALDKRVEHIYFLARDGCAINEFSERWRNPIIDRHLSPHSASDIYMNRILSCWGGVDFSGDWLVQAIGLVFWLNHGEASPEEMCSRLGVEAVPTAFGAEVLRTDRDTFRVAKILQDEGLVETVRQEIIRKRELIVRHLQDIGFFEHRSVAFSDVGYSGTVLRDLNSLFVSKLGSEGINPPSMHLHLIATNNNYEVNRSRSYPFVRFSSQVVLPNSLLPESLTASFSWLEFFFKHRTLQPILRFVERNGKLVPELRHHEGNQTPIPTERVLAFAETRDDDIVPLWMAAVNFHAPLVDPVVARFNDPDADTLSQMSDEIFELHSVQGSRRSIILDVPGGRVEAIALAAREGDYWIPGSIAASRAAVPELLQDSPNSHRRRTPGKKILRLIRGKKHAVNVPPIATSRSFDARFYRDFYPDLRHFTSDEELWQHYFVHGRQEKRLANYDALVAQLTAEFGPIPTDFDPNTYLALNQDIASQIDRPERALDHYMRAGQKEGRPYRFVRREVVREFDVLHARGKIALSPAEETAWTKGTSALDIFLSRYGVKQGPWIDEINPAEFRALHSKWAGPVENKAECIIALFENGLERSPALSLSCEFDPNFYRKQAGRGLECPAHELYHHYLSQGSRRGLAPSEGAALKRLWGYSDFPEEFNWQAFAESLGLQVPLVERFDILRQFVDTPGIERLRFLSPSAGGRLIEFLAVRTKRVYGRLDEAKQLLQAGLKLSQNHGVFHHLLGDLALQTGNHTEALRHFRDGILSASPNRWSFIHAAELLVEQGNHALALGLLERGEDQWERRAPWRRVYERALELRCRETLHDLLSRDTAAEDLAKADRLFSDIAKAFPARMEMKDAGRGVLLLTMRASSSARRDRALIDGITVLDLLSIEQEDYLAALLAHEIVIFHELPFTYEVLRAIAAARSLGKRTIAWLGDLVNWQGHQLSHCEWNEEQFNPSPLKLTNFVEMALPARYCDEIVTNIFGFIPFIKNISDNIIIHYLPSDLHLLSDSHKDHHVVFVVPLSDASGGDVHHLARALRKVAQEDPRVHILADRRLCNTPDFQRIAGRWTHLSEDMDLPALAQTIQLCDGVVQLLRNPSRQYAAWADAHRAGVPAITLAKTPASGGIRREDQRSAAEPWPEGLKRMLVSDTDAVAYEVSRSLRRKGTPKDALFTPQRATTGTTRSDKRQRILFVNIFFPPQVIGGATRVLKDNIDYFIDHRSQDYEFAILCADEENNHSGEWRLDGYRGIPVFRIATPQELNMDWRAANEMVGARFAAVMRAFKPDLVHIHCLQRLGVVVAEVCQEMGIPYIVTLHDAWWLSNYPFMTDQNGQLVQVERDFRTQVQLPEVGSDVSLLRAERLRRALLNARDRLAVSQSFADLYEACGISCRVIENGTPRILPKPKPAKSDTHIHLCHVGGLEYHKGAYLVEAALRTNRYDNLHFTVVDLARGMGQDTHAIWGTTPVTITGKMSTEELALFYARMHVLIAPSTWPESYGLVTREAIAHGLWVIAGNRGAVGDPVRPENGFIVSVSDTNDLSKALNIIDRHPEKYRCAPAHLLRSRSANDQSQELLYLYKSILQSPS
ncbi:HAD-IA family hydrolase [Sphingobium sp. HDIP04]|uniref:HAD-IA family hydrolase n=1 Tax=Sphingobium sp. HDIP04 TaxID=428994 RepID=UPI000413839F|nr:HAD-IA family hydrolase [Sphingobium sp. HDIP04]